MKKNNPPLVSAIITTHNRAKILPNAIDSVLNQTYKNIEIVVVDDGSKDNTQEIIQKYCNKNIVNYKHDKALGACAARNSGIKTAKGEFVAGLDDDDEWLPERIEKMLKAYDDKYAFVYSDSIRNNGRKRTVEYRKEHVTFEQMLQGENLVGTQILVKKERILDLGGFDGNLPASQDYDMWLRLLKKYPIAIGVNEPLMIRDTSDRINRISVSPWKAFRGKFRVYKKNKQEMKKELRKRRIYEIRKILHPMPSFNMVITLAPRGSLLKELRRFVTYRLKKYFTLSR